MRKKKYEMNKNGMSLEWANPRGAIDLWLQHTQTQPCCQEARRWSNMYN